MKIKCPRCWNEEIKHVKVPRIPSGKMWVCLSCGITKTRDYFEVKEIGEPVPCTDGYRGLDE